MAFAAAAVPYLVAASAVVSAASAVAQGQAQRAAMNYQAQVARNNQVIAGQYANIEIQKGQQLEAEKRLETGQQEGAIRAAAGASGLDPNAAGSSPLRLQADTATLGEADAQVIRANAQRAAYGYDVQGLSYAGQASLDEMGATNAARAGALNAFASILGGASSVSDKYARFQQSGVFS